MGQYKDAWTGFARAHGEEVMLCEDTPANEQRLIQQANYHNGRYVLVWPQFIPSPVFFQELDYYREQGIYLVKHTKYRYYFNPGDPVPYKQENIGTDRNVLIFQMAGQNKWTVAQNASFRTIEKLKCRRSMSLSSEASFDDISGHFNIRSILGDTLPGVAHNGQVYNIGIGGLYGGATVKRRRQLEIWRAAVEAMSIWGRIKK